MAPEASPVAVAGAQPQSRSAVGDDAIGVALNSAWLLASQGLLIGVTSLVGILAVRLVSTADWGRYSAAMALIAILGVVAEVGITTLALRELSSETSEGALVYGSAALAICVSAAIAAVLVAPSVYLLDYSWSTASLVVLASPLLLLVPLLSLLRSIFNAHRLLRPVAQYTVVQCATLAGLAVPLLLLGGGVEALVIGVVASTAMALGVAAVLANRKIGLAPRLRGGATTVRPFVLAAIPIGAIGIITIVYERVDVLLLARLASPVEVAHYAVPYMLVKLTLVLPSVVSAVFFPVLNANFERNRLLAEQQFFFVVRAFFFVSIPVALFLAVGSSDILPFVFGSDYASSADVLQIVAWTAILGFQNFVIWYAILAARLERRVTAIMVVGLAFNVALNLVLIPRHGSVGAAVALVASELLVTLWTVVLVHRQVFRVPLRAVALKPAVVALIVVPLSIVLAREYSPIVAACAGAVGCVVGLVVLGYISRQELRPFVPASWRAEPALRD
jgi:O-antigen/teichoic acid export membrane protein